MNSIYKTALLLLLMGATASNGFAGENKFHKRHPRRAEVVDRANREEKKNNDAAEDGKITHGQAKRLDHQDNLIKKEEQADSAANGGRITQGEQRDLNRQENQVNRERSRMEKRDAAGKAGPATPSTRSN